MTANPSIAYSYRADTKEFAGQIDLHLDPMETQKQKQNVYLLPLNATITAPPAAQSEVAYTWNGMSWDSVVDNRGDTAYSTTTAQPSIVQSLGALPSGFTFLDPSTVVFPQWNGTAWVVNTALAWKNHQYQAQSLLNKSDIIVTRASEDGVVVPDNWKTYRNELRAIISSQTGDYTQPLPTAPTTYPEAS